MAHRDPGSSPSNQTEELASKLKRRRVSAAGFFASDSDSDSDSSADVEPVIKDELASYLALN